LTAIAPAVRFNAFAIRATPAFFFASDFNSRTSDDVHARLTVVFFADFFLADFFLAMSAPQFGTALVSRRQLATQRSLSTN
jgi:hypothetical protein